MTLSILYAVAWGVIVAGAGAWLTDLSPWYYGLRKPGWKPPDWLFGPAWTTILSLASYALYLGLEYAPDNAGRALVVGLFVLNGAANMVWSLLFFRRRRPDQALAEVVVLWGSIVALMVVLAPISRIASLCFLPYLVWVSFASVLNLSIVRANHPFVGRNDRLTGPEPARPGRGAPARRREARLRPAPLATGADPRPKTTRTDWGKRP